MPEKRAKADPLFATTWVHVFEEDSAKGAVYRAEDDASIPLSRRPRERIQLQSDGSATVQLSGADDRYVEHGGTDYMAYTFRPRCSHWPRAVIQNDWAISFRSRQNVAHPAQWTRDGNAIVISTGKRQLRLVEQSPTRLVIQTQSDS